MNLMDDGFIKVSLLILGWVVKEKKKEIIKRFMKKMLA